MDVREFEEFVPCVIERMRADGCAEGPIGTAEWVLRWFAEFCREEEVGDASMPAMRSCRRGRRCASRSSLRWNRAAPGRTARPTSQASSTRCRSA